MHYQPLLRIDGVEVRTHGTTLYNSMYRSDHQLLVNAHAWGVNAYGAPVWHLRRSGSGGMFDTNLAPSRSPPCVTPPPRRLPPNPPTSTVARPRPGRLDMYNDHGDLVARGEADP